MYSDVYITRLSKFLPGDPVSNDEIEDYLGIINEVCSRTKNIILRQNGIKTRYYAIDKNGNLNYTNSQLTAHAIKLLTDENFKTEDIDMLCCGTSLPDQLIPSHAAMVHGEIKGKAIEILSPSGACCTGMSALKYGYFSVLSGNTKNAVCTGSELISPVIKADFFKAEVNKKKIDNKTTLLGFEKDFLRWMLSDGAGAALLQNEPSGKLSLKIEWIEIISFANEIEVCMYSGAEKNGSSIKGWKEHSQIQCMEQSVFALKQDVKILDKYIDQVGVSALSQTLKKRKVDPAGIDYILPHISSEYFRKRLNYELVRNDIYFPEEKWFTNLSSLGNVGSASVYFMMEELFNSGKLKKGQKLLLLVPESARFTYSFALLTVC